MSGKDQDRHGHSRAEDTRARILDAAATEFAAAGYAGTSLSAILKASGASKGAFYFHFPSKEDLAVAVVDHLREDWLQASASGVTEGTRGVEKLQALALGSTRAYREMPGYRAIGKLCSHLSSVRPDLAPQLRTTFADWIDLIERALVEAQEDGDIPKSVDARSLAEISAAAFTGMQEVSELMSAGEDLESRVEEFITLTLRLLGAASPTAASPTAASPTAASPAPSASSAASTSAAASPAPSASPAASTSAPAPSAASVLRGKTARPSEPVSQRGAAGRPRKASR